MATDGIQIIVDDREVLAALDRLAGAPLDDALNAIGGKLVFSTQRRFETETDPEGRKWQKLSPRTAAKRIGRGRRGYDHILRVKARLYSSIHFEVSADSVAVGTDVKYAAIHQLGGVIKRPARRQTIYQAYNAKTDTLDPRFRPRRASNFARDVDVKEHTITIPARPYLGLSAEDRADILAIVEHHYRKQVAGSAAP